jgi:phenylpyruvate tautomerase PptA (4-oxalocrotonate tautomerase family)
LHASVGGEGQVERAAVRVDMTESTRTPSRAISRRRSCDWEQVPDLPLFTNNTAAFIHDLDADAISSVDGESNYMRVQVLTPVGVLDRDKQLGVVRELTEIVAAAAGDPSLSERTWVLLTESPEGGWGIGGHANTNADIAAAARAALGGS